MMPTWFRESWTPGILTWALRCPPLFSSGNKNQILPSPGSSSHWLTQRWGHKWFWKLASKNLKGGDLLAPAILSLITTALTAIVYNPPGCFWGENSHCYWFFLQKNCEIGMNSPPKALGPESARWTFALNMQLPWSFRYSQVYFLISKVRFKAEIAVISTLRSRRCSKQVFMLQAHRPLSFKYM